MMRMIFLVTMSLLKAASFEFEHPGMLPNLEQSIYSFTDLRRRFDYRGSV